MLISARKLLKANPIDLFDQLTETYTVRFDDADVELLGVDIACSRYAWIFHVKDPSFPLLSHMTVLPYLKKGIFNIATMRGLFNHILWQAYDHYDKQVNAYELAGEIQLANMAFYNALTIKCAKYITSLTILDYLDLHYHPKLQALKQQAKDSNYDSVEVDNVIQAATALMSGGELRDAEGKLLAIPKSCLANIIKSPQAVQAVFMRGQVPDLRMENIPYALVRSLTEGMNTPLEYSILSREGALAELASLDDLSRVCYNGRKLALVAQAKKSLVKGDCGSKNYVYWTVSEPVYHEGKLVTPSDLPWIIGIWYLAEDGSLKQVQASDTWMYGRTIQRRSALTCSLSNGAEVCSVCAGALSEVMEHGGNLGVDIAKHFSQDKAQSTLSLKHLLASLIGEAARLDAVGRKYLSVENNVYTFLPSVYETATKLQIEFNKGDIFNLSQIDTVYEVYAMIPSKISMFSSFILHIQRGSTWSSVEIFLSKTNVKCMLSYDTLALIKHKGVENCVSFNDSSCIIDISELKDKPVFIKPEALPPISEMSKNLSRIFERAGDEREVTSSTDVLSTLERLNALVLSMGGAHISTLEILLSSYLTRSDSYKVANGTNGIGGLHHQTGESLLLKRSLATWLIYNSPVTAFFNSPSTFLRTDRDDSVLDVFVDPAGVYKANI